MMCLIGRTGMRKRLLFTLSLLAPTTHAGQLEPLISFKNLFQTVPDKLRQLSPEEIRLQSDFDRLQGGTKARDSGMSLYTSERDFEVGQCLGAGCGPAETMNMSQRRGGLAWNVSDDESFRLAPHAEVIRYQMGMSPSTPGLQRSGVGLGLGVDGSWRLNSQFSAYASAGVAQFEQRSGYEGLMGIATNINRSRLFMEARWSEMNQNVAAGQPLSSYDFSNIRIGISRSFFGL